MPEIVEIGAAAHHAAPFGVATNKSSGGGKAMTHDMPQARARFLLRAAATHITGSKPAALSLVDPTAI